MKRYRSPKLKPGYLYIYYGRLEGDDPDVVYANGEGVPRCDRALLHCVMGTKRLIYDGTYEPSLFDELAARGYDLDTLKFSIQKKAP